MDETLELTEIASRSGVAPRRLRYILDHGLLPGGKVASRGRGAARRFTLFESFGIACAALMLEAGLRRALVRECLALLCTSKIPGFHKSSEVPLYQAFAAQDVAFLEVGDWVNVRLMATSNLHRKYFDTGWRQVTTGAQLEAYEPLVLVRLNVARLRRVLAG